MYNLFWIGRDKLTETTGSVQQPGRAQLIDFKRTLQNIICLGLGRGTAFPVVTNWLRPWTWTDPLSVATDLLLQALDHPRRWLPCLKRHSFTWVYPLQPFPRKSDLFEDWEYLPYPTVRAGKRNRKGSGSGRFQADFLLLFPETSSQYLLGETMPSL